MANSTHHPPTLAELRNRRLEILRIAQAYGVSNVRVFGSVARGETTPASDVDFLADFPPHFTLLDLAGVVQDLQTLLDCPVQVASADHLRDEMRLYILQDVQPL